MQAALYSVQNIQANISKGLCFSGFGLIFKAEMVTYPTVSIEKQQQSMPAVKKINTVLKKLK